MLLNVIVRSNICRRKGKLFVSGVFPVARASYNRGQGVMGWQKTKTFSGASALQR